MSTSKGLRKEFIEAIDALRCLQPFVEQEWQSRTAAGEDPELVKDEILAEYERERERLDAFVLKTLPDIPVRPGDEEHTLTTVWTQAFRTQGFGAVRYTKAKAEMIAAEATDSVDVEICAFVEEIYPDKASGAPGDEPIGFEVKAKVQDRSDAEALFRGPRWTLREQVRQCWERGVNPRVYNPGIPHGFEESEGLDFYGKDLRKD